MQVHYVGVAHSTGEEFDASYNRGAPLAFRLGVGQVIQGWDTGVQGMKVGGRRKLVIPPHLGYGDRGAGGAIEPGETLDLRVRPRRVSAESCRPTAPLATKTSGVTTFTVSIGKSLR